MNEFFFRFAQSVWLYAALIMVCGAIVARLKIVKRVLYQYTLGNFLYDRHLTSSGYYKAVLFAMRLLSLLMLAFLLGKPQLVDSHSKVHTEGIDIVLALDISGSMQHDDFGPRHLSRIEAAKTEAIRFIEKRKYDALGLVIFAQDAVSRAPITADKKLLHDIINELHIGVINPDGTKLATAIVTAVNRLKDSHAKSKVIILLTDGEPSPDDIDPSVALEVAKKFGIKIYTIGIGSDDGVVIHNLFGMPIGRFGVNKKLLQDIAQQTGGQFFMATDVQGMREVYDTIDQLETTEIEVPVFTKYYDIFIPFVACVIGLVCIELFLSACVWFSI